MISDGIACREWISKFHLSNHDTDALIKAQTISHLPFVFRGDDRSLHDRPVVVLAAYQSIPNEANDHKPSKDSNRPVPAELLVRICNVLEVLYPTNLTWFPSRPV